MTLFSGVSKRELDRAISLVELRSKDTARSLVASAKGNEDKRFENTAKSIWLLGQALGLGWSTEKRDWVKKELLNEEGKLLPTGEKAPEPKGRCEVVVEGQGADFEAAVKSLRKIAATFADKQEKKNAKKAK